MMRGSILTVLVILVAVLVLAGGGAYLLLSEAEEPPQEERAPENQRPDPVDVREDEPPVADFAVPETPFPRPEKGAAFVPPDGGAEDLLHRVEFDVLGEHVAAAIPLLRQLAVQESRGEWLAATSAEPVLDYTPPDFALVDES